MTRSPLFYPLNRGGDSDAGGAADLQTDVMRFMAILSLCLVAIFALVQSMPLAPTTPAQISAEPEMTMDDAASPAPTLQDAVDEKAENQSDELNLTRPKHARLPPRQQPVVLQRPIVPRTTSKPPATTPQKIEKRQEANDQKPSDRTVSARPTPTSEAKGFTLQFETDAALTRLVERQVVGFYAMTHKDTFRLNIANENIGFWSASTPAQFHEMETSTVPDKVVDAFTAAHPNTGVKWGVTLTPNMSRTLSNYLRSTKSGALVIASSGEISLRQ